MAGDISMMVPPKKEKTFGELSQLDLPTFLEMLGIGFWKERNYFFIKNFTCT
jgi:hypothetical protein